MRHSIGHHQNRVSVLGSGTCYASYCWKHSVDFALLWIRGFMRCLLQGQVKSTVAAFAADCKSVSGLQAEATDFGVLSLLVW